MNVPRSTASSLLPRDGPLPRRAVSFKASGLPGRPACGTCGRRILLQPRRDAALGRAATHLDGEAWAPYAPTIADARSEIAATTRSAMRSGVKPISSCSSGGLPCVT
jgi:hypothetical protein